MAAIKQYWIATPSIRGFTNGFSAAYLPAEQCRQNIRIINFTSGNGSIGFDKVDVTQEMVGDNLNVFR